MPAFDVALALSQGELNQAVAAAYWKLYPRLFTGSNTGFAGMAAEWSVAAPPQLDLSHASQQFAMSAIAENALEKQSNSVRNKAQGAANEFVSSAADLHELMQSVLTFQVDFPKVDIVLTQRDSQKVAYALANVKAHCIVRLTGSSIVFLVNKVTADPLPNSMDNFFVKAFILPALEKALQEMLLGLQIPPLEFSGIQLSAPSVSIVDNHIVVAVNLASKGIPAPAPAGSWTPMGFSLLVSRDIMQTAAGKQGKSFGNSGGSGDKWAGYNWDYSLSLVNPQISFSGANVNINFSLSGSVGATAYIIYIPIGLGFRADAHPNPTAVCRLVPRNGKVEIVTQYVSPFSVLVSPTGSIPAKVAGWIISGIVSAVIASVSPVISQFLGGITFTSIDIPKFSGNIEGVPITLTPTNLNTVGVGEYIGLGGSLTIS